MKTQKPKAKHKSEQGGHAFAVFDKRTKSAPKSAGGGSSASAHERTKGGKKPSKPSRFEDDAPRSQKDRGFKGQQKPKYEGRNKGGKPFKSAPKTTHVDTVLSVARAYNGKTVSPCPVAKNCGACQLIHLPYEAQLSCKQEAMQKLLGSFGKVSPILGMANPTHYRNKVHATFKNAKGGKVIAGMYEEGTHNVVQTKSCLLQDQRANAIVETLTQLMMSFKMKAYDEDNASGIIRHVLIRTGHVSGEIMVVLVIGSKILPAKNNFLRALLEAHPEITTIVLNHNSRSTSMVLGDQETVLYGKGTIEDTLCETVFRISPKSFYQINAVQTEVLYGKAIEFAGLTGSEVVLDAYCGIGTIGLIASKHAKEVIGVELNKDAVRDAISNARRNGIKNTRFYEGDAGEFMRAVAGEGAKLDVVFMDPPRAGSDEAFLSSLVHLAPPKVVYVSCNPETLARDLKYLTQNGYKVEKIQPVDMFAGTGHVETVVRLQRVIR